jgi:hypothetical protein
MKTIFALAALLVPCLALAQPYYGPTSNAQISPAGWNVIQQTPPSATEQAEASFDYYPVTACGSGNVQKAVVSTASGQCSFAAWIWDNRYCCGHAKGAGNPINPAVFVGNTRCFAYFTTLARANDATEAQSAYALGYSASTYNAYATNDGMPNAVPYSTFVANAASYCNSRDATGQLVATDTVILPNETLADLSVIAPNGVVLDVESHDGRSGATELTLVQTIAALAHAAGTRLTIYTNPMENKDFKNNGIFPYGNSQWNTDAIAAAADYFSFFLWHGTQFSTFEQELSFDESQFQSFLPAKTLIQWDLQNGPAQACSIYDTATANGVAGVSFFPDGATLGNPSPSDPVNEQLGDLTGIAGC